MRKEAYYFSHDANAQDDPKIMKMIDNMLHMKRLHLAMYGHINKTRSGNLRKGSGIYNAIDGILNSRLKLNQTT